MNMVRKHFCIEQVQRKGRILALSIANNSQGMLSPIGLRSHSKIIRHFAKCCTVWYVSDANHILVSSFVFLSILFMIVAIQKETQKLPLSRTPNITADCYFFFRFKSNETNVISFLLHIECVHFNFFQFINSK